MIRSNELIIPKGVNCAWEEVLPPLPLAYDKGTKDLSRLSKCVVIREKNPCPCASRIYSCARIVYLRLAGPKTIPLL